MGTYTEPQQETNWYFQRFILLTTFEIAETEKRIYEWKIKSYFLLSKD